MANGGRRGSDWRPWVRPEPAAEAPAERPEPAAERRGRRVRSPALTGLFLLACVYTLSLASAFLIPLAVGLMVYFFLRPPVRGLKAARVPEPVGAALVVLGLIAVVGAAIYALSWPAAAWLARGPESVQRVEARLRPIARRLQRLTHTAEEMGRITETTAPTSAAPTPEVRLKEPSFGALFVGGVQSLLAGTMVVVTLVYFMLAEGDGLLRRVIRAYPRVKDRERAVVIAHEMERQISGYLFYTTVINVAFGALIAVVLWLMGMPSPILWGVVAAVTKFVPYLGGLACAVVLALASIITFPDLWWALLVPAVFVVIDTIHGNFVMPLLLGRRFTLDPTMLFVGLFFWWFVWGTTGALLAVPMMSALRIFCEHVDGWQRLGRLLGGTEEPPSAEPAGADAT